MNLQAISLAAVMAAFHVAAATRWLPVDSNGWTVLAPSLDSRTVYVSSSTGHDTNSGLSAASPKATLEAGVALMRDGYPDWLLLKRGDVWTYPTATFLFTTLNFPDSGRSASEPAVYTSYGPGVERPLIEAGPNRGIRVRAGHYKVVRGLAFYAHTRDPDNPAYNATDGKNGLEISGPGTHYLVEDCKFRFFASNTAMGQPGRPNYACNVVIRRCVIVDDYAVGSHSQGLFCDMVDGLLLEENVLDHNGWHATIPGAGKTIFNHNYYIQSQQESSGKIHGCYDVVVRRNILARPSSHGCQLRPGGYLVENVFLACPLAAFATGAQMGNVNSFIVSNVVLDADDIASNPRGYGLGAGPCATNTCMYNIVANKRPGLGKQEAIAVYGSSAMTTPTFYRVMHNTVVDWYRANNHPVFEIGTGTGAPDNVISGNLLQNDSTIQDTTLMENDSGAQTLFDLASNVYYCTQPASEWFRRDGSTLLSFTQWTNWADETAGRQLQVALRDPTRSAASYNYARGGEASLEAYLAGCRQQSQAAWRDDYTALALIRYIHEGFRPTVDLGPTQVGAVWPPDTSAMYELIARAEGPGRIDPDPNGFYVQGATVSVQAVSLGPPEWFAGWTGDRTGTDNPLIVRLTSNVTVTAVFVPEPGLVAWAVVALGLLRRGGQKTRE